MTENRSGNAERDPGAQHTSNPKRVADSEDSGWRDSRPPRLLELPVRLIQGAEPRTETRKLRQLASILLWDNVLRRCSTVFGTELNAN